MGPRPATVVYSPEPLLTRSTDREAKRTYIKVATLPDPVACNVWYGPRKKAVIKATGLKDPDVMTNGVLERIPGYKKMRKGPLCDRLADEPWVEEDVSGMITHGRAINMGLDLTDAQKLAKKTFSDPNVRSLGLFFDMGQGKTLAAIVAALEVQKKSPMKVIILCPTPLVENWKAEIKEHTAKQFVGDGEKDVSWTLRSENAKKQSIGCSQEWAVHSSTNKQWWIVPFSCFSGPKKTVQSAMSHQSLLSFKDAIIIVDEVHNLRNIKKGARDESGEQMKSTTVDRIFDRIRIGMSSPKTKLLILSGTPIQNRFSDMVPVIRLLNPDEDKTEIENCLMTARTLVEAKKPLDRALKVQMGRYLNKKIILASKSDGMPAFWSQYVDVDLSDGLSKRIDAARKGETSDAFRNQSRKILHAGEPDSPNPKLDKLVEWIKVIDKERKELWEDTPLENKLKNFPKHLIYTPYVTGHSGVKKIAERLRREFEGEEVLELTGETRADMVKQLPVRWNNVTAKARFLVMSNVGAEGLSLKNTENVHIFESAWNSEANRQIYYRAIRRKAFTADCLKDSSYENGLVTVNYYIARTNLPADRDFNVGWDKSMAEAQKLVSPDLYMAAQCRVKDRSVAAVQGLLKKACVSNYTNYTS